MLPALNQTSLNYQIRLLHVCVPAKTAPTFSLYVRNNASIEKIDTQKVSGVTTTLYFAISRPGSDPWPGGWRPLL